MILLEFNDTEQENDSRVMLKAFFPDAKIVTNIPEAGHDKPELFEQYKKDIDAFYEDVIERNA